MVSSGKGDDGVDGDVDGVVDGDDGVSSGKDFLCSLLLGLMVTLHR